MERGATGYSQSDAPVALYHSQQEARPNVYATANTPTSEYGAQPISARSGSFPEHIHRQYHPASNHSVSSGSMAQPTNPSIAASSPTYPHGQYSPYPQQDMSHGYPGHPQSAMYAQPRPDWAGYAGHPQHPSPMGYGVNGGSTPTSAAAPGQRPPHQQHHPAQVYSFVPIPGAQQHKRPRRRFEEIERMYKCGWNGCEKAYGTLNHLNAHVTMQSHGIKRTPEEFKEIRKEWKARKKEEENQRKAEDERARAAAGPSDGQQPDVAQSGYQPARSVQLPPIGYSPGAQVPGQYQAPPGNVQQLQDYQGQSHMAQQYSGYPASPYGAPPNMYSNQQHGAPAPKYEH